MNLPVVEQARTRALALLNPTRAQLEHGLELHRQSIVVDAYGFAPYALPADAERVMRDALEAGAPHAELGQRLLSLNVTGKIRDAQALAEFVAAFDAAGVTCIGQNAGEGRNVFESLERMALFTHVCDELPNVVRKAVRAEDVELAKQEKRHCLLFSLNEPILYQAWDYWRQELYPLEIFRNAGIRMMHVAYNRRNHVGDGCAEPGNAGLSDFGIDVVHEMNRLGIIVDLAHAGWRTCVDACKASGKPVIVSHSACAAVHHHIRGKPDEVIRAVVETGGYIGIAVIPPFLGKNATILTLLDHIDHVLKKFGADHVAIGSDANYQPAIPDSISQIFRGFKRQRSFASHWPADDPIFAAGSCDECMTQKAGSLSWTNWPLFTVGMVQRGYSDEQIRKIIGGNCMRVMRDVLSRN